MKVNFVRNEFGEIVGVAWRLFGRVGTWLGRRAEPAPLSVCVCGEQLCDCGCDCHDSEA